LPILLRNLQLQSHEADILDFDWAIGARPGQEFPETPWRQLLILGGRGSGKTRAGAEWVRARATGAFPVGARPARRIALVAPTFDEARLVMIEGESGLLAIHENRLRPRFEVSKRQLTWPNGSIAQVFSAEEPDGLRGPQFDAAWCDELAKWPRADAVWDMLQFGLRLGEAPQAVVTTTPRPVPILKRLRAASGTEFRHWRSSDNAIWLAPDFISVLNERYGGTRLGRQELDGELIEDDPNALFKRAAIEEKRVRQAPPLARIVVAVDPPASQSETANACGIVCAGLGEDRRCYVLDDCSVQGLRPAQWAARVVALFHARQADRIVAEVNQGGAMVEAVLREVDSTVPYRAVHATRGKRTRAEPVAALYEQGRVSHVGAFPELEDEMCSALDGAKSPDRLDALVWAVTELMLKRRAEPRISFI
jgi:phage terminase large subunit-like protein